MTNYSRSYIVTRTIVRTAFWLAFCAALALTSWVMAVILIIDLTTN